MPPKNRFTKDEMIDAALDIVREKGIDALTARSLGTRMGSSTRPMFTYFSTVNELKEAVRVRAAERYRDVMREGLKDRIPFLGVGRRQIKFAAEEPWLYRLLFLTPYENIQSGKGTDELPGIPELKREVVASITEIYRVDVKTAEQYYENMWLVGNSVAVQIVTGSGHFATEDIERIFEQFSLALFKAYRELPGFIDMTLDKDAEFRRLIGGNDNENN